MHKMRFEQTENLLIVCHGRLNPSDDEWLEFTRLVSSLRHRSAHMRTLIWTSGGGPTAAQRKSLNDALAGESSLVAVVSGHPGVRFLVSALALVNHDIKAFSPNEIPDALLYLGVSTDARRVLLNTVQRLIGQIDARN